MQTEPPVAFVTGAGSGIGQATARRLIADGYFVVGVGRSQSKLDDAFAGFDHPRQYATIAADVGDRSVARKAVEDAVRQFGPIRLLVNNAGVNTKQRSMVELSAEEWDRQIRINLSGVYNVIAAALPTLRTVGGLIVNISSVAALRPSKLAGAAYAASKAGVNALGAVVAQEEAVHGVRCSTICPGEVDTPILNDRPEAVSPERRAVILQPEDVAAAVSFLASLSARAHVPELIIKPTAHNW